MKKLIVGAALIVGACWYWDYKQTQDFEYEKAQPVAEVVQLEVEEYKYKWRLEGATIQEELALEAFQERGITDRLALATLMGNIKQESLFRTDICECGARVPYERCHSGGYGLIQWTTVN